MEKEETGKGEAAARYFKEGFNCCQSVIAPFAKKYGLSCESALKVAAGFGGGLGRLGETCGAVSGALMVIGLQHGAVRADDKESRQKTYDLVKEFVRRFKELNQTILCRELLECDLGTPEGVKQAMEQKLIATRCPRFVREAAALVDMILAEKRV
jgi:C_GCAxxG_C_C family probable redox protein